MRLTLIAEPSDCTQLPDSVQCTPTYCILEPAFNRVAVGLKNILAKAITMPSKVVVGKLLDIGSTKFGGIGNLDNQPGIFQLILLMCFHNLI